MFSRRLLCEAEIQPQLKCSTQIILEREREAVLPVKPVPSFDCGQPETSWESPPEEKVEVEELLDLVLSP